MGKKRQDAIMELISTEESYIDDMTAVHDVNILIHRVTAGDWKGFFKILL